MIILWIILCVLAVWIAVLLIRAGMYRPHAQQETEVTSVDVDKDKIREDMAALIRCKTVSHHDKTLEDQDEFRRFHEVLQQRFPLVHTHCSKECFADTGILFVWKGKEQGNPTVLMAHYDVVPVEEEKWSKPPFEAIVEDGVMWGRGTLDTKGTLCGVLEAAEQLLAVGHVPERDIWMAFCGDEETTGKSCDAMVKEFAKRGITPAMVLDEGGAIVENVFPGVTKPSALIGIAEKGRVNAKLTIHTKGGHASTPPVTVSVVELARAVTRLSKRPFKQQKTLAVDAMFDTLGRESSFAMKIIFANLWCFRPLFYLICAKAGGEMNAMTRTTCAPTKLTGSQEYNVLPTEATAGYNIRLLGDDTVESAKAHIAQSIHHDQITVEMLDGVNPSRSSDIACQEYQKLNTVIRESFPGVIVSPYLMMACSDSRHYCAISDKVYRFTPMMLSKEERGMIHGIDERIPLETLYDTVRFYVRLMKQI